MQTPLTKNMRLVMLRAIYDMNGMTANDSMLDDALQFWGTPHSRDVIKSEMVWLSEQGLIDIREQSDNIIAVLTQRGEDVATGKATNPGVKRWRVRL